MPDVSYDISDINNYIRFTMIQNGYNKDLSEAFGINVYTNPVFNRVTISVNNEFSLNLGMGLAKFLGFDSTQLQITNQEVSGQYRANVERVNNIVINCNLAENHNIFTSNALCTFSPNEVFGVMLSINLSYPVWTSCRNASFNYIEVWFADQENRP